MRSFVSRTALGVAAACVMAACTSGFRSAAAPAQIYVLRPAPSAATQAGNASPIAASLRIVRPEPGPGLDSDRIVLVRSDRRMNFYAASRWPSDLPEMVEALIVGAFREGGAWAAVHDSRSPFQADYFLETSIRNFEADDTGGASPEVRVRIDCAIGRTLDRAVVATFTVEGTATAAANRMSDVVAAFERAAGAALAQLTERAAAAVRTSTAPSPP